MSYSDKALRGARRQLQIQLGLALLAGLVFTVMHSVQAGGAALFGGLIAAANSVLEIWYLRRTHTATGVSAERTMRLLYRYAAERFATTVALFAIGLGLMKLLPLPLVLGFILGQLAIGVRWFSKI
jgi:ATP synthase protein I